MKKELWEQEKYFLYLFSNEDINYIIKTIKSLENSGVLTVGITKTVKHEKQAGGFLGALSVLLAASIVQPVISLVLLHPLSNIDITNYFNYKPRFHGVFSRNNLHRIKDGAYVMNLDDKKRKGTHQVSLFNVRNTAVYFDSFGIEDIPSEALKKIKDKSITCNAFRMQDNESILCGFYCIAFICL